MQYTQNLTDFFLTNDVEITKLIASVSRCLNYTGDGEDLKHDLFVRMHTLKILQRYKVERSKISTFLFKIIKNMILTIFLENRCKKYEFQDSCQNCADDVDEMDQVIQREQLHPDYVTLVERNRESDELHGKAAELLEFIQHLSNSSKNKTHKCYRRKFKDINTAGYDLVEILDLMYKGFTGHEIALKHGVTDMTISHTKRQIAKLMVSFGVEVPKVKSST